MGRIRDYNKGDLKGRRKCERHGTHRNERI